MLGPGLRLIKERIYRAAVSQRLRNTALEDFHIVRKHSEKLLLGAKKTKPESEEEI